MSPPSLGATCDARRRWKIDCRPPVRAGRLSRVSSVSCFCTSSPSPPPVVRYAAVSVSRNSLSSDFLRGPPLRDSPDESPLKVTELRFGAFFGFLNLLSAASISSSRLSTSCSRSS